MTRRLVYAAQFKTRAGFGNSKLEKIDFAEICEDEQFDEVFERASKVSVVIGIIQLEDPIALARIAAHGMAGLINERK